MIICTYNRKDLKVGMLGTIQERIEMVNNTLNHHHIKPLELEEVTGQIAHVLLSRFIAQFASRHKRAYIKWFNYTNKNADDTENL